MGTLTTSGRLWKATPLDSTADILARTNGNFDALDSVVVQTQVATMAASASMATDASVGGPFKIIVSDATAFTISNPTNAVSGKTIVYDILNSSGGVMGTITWGSEFALAGAFTNPASTKRRTISFYRNTADVKWVEVSRAAVDI